MRNTHETFSYAVLIATLFSAQLAWAEVTPLDAPLKEDGITRITCFYGGDPVTPIAGVTLTPTKGEYHYDLYLPEGYFADPKALYPCLFVASPSGNARLGVMADRVKRDRFIAVMLPESKNGPWEPGVADFCSAHDDVVKRVRIAEGFKYMTGMSGGARSTSMYTALRPGFAGMFLQAAAFWQTDAGPYAMTSVLNNPRLAVYATFGTTDMNLEEAGWLAQYLPPKTAYHVVVFRGGHQWAPRAQVEEAFDWLEQWTYFTLSPDTSATGRSMYLSYANRLVRQCQEAKTSFEKYERMDKLIRFAASHEFEVSPSLKETLTDYRKQTPDLAADESMKKEIAAREAFLQAAAGEEIGRRHAGRNVEKWKAALIDARKTYQSVADDHAHTIYAAKAAAAVERLKIEQPD